MRQKYNEECITRSYDFIEIVDVIKRLDGDMCLIGKLYICGFSEDEIAERLSISEKVVKKNILQIKKELKKNLV